MELFLIFFRDTLSGFIYYLYVALCIFAIFYVFGFVAKRKRKAINDKLKEKKQYDIASGREAAIAAMESKQVLNVEEDEESNEPNATLADAAGESTPNVEPDQTKQEEVPAVMVFDSNASSTAPAEQPQETPSGPQVEQPLVIDASTLQ